MTFFERLRVHRGGLVRLRADHWWFCVGMEGEGYSGMSGTVCLIFDAVEGRKRRRSHVEACGGGTAKGGDTDCNAEVLLLIEGAPRWIRIEENDLEIL